jgi:phosphoribosylanthranilate isomerase
MFRIKICGITTPNDARAAIEAGADAIGLNFYPDSPRYIDRERARAIVDAVGNRVCKVGLFVNDRVDEVRTAYDELDLDLIQLHGDEPADYLRALAPRPVMKAFRVGPYKLVPLRKWFDEAMRSALIPQLVLIDAFQRDKFGGTGVVADWSQGAAYTSMPGLPPLVLAGGLKAENVGDAIATVRPAAIDTAGGVERSPGIKDHAKMRAFVDAARAAFDNIAKIQ